MSASPLSLPASISGDLWAHPSPGPALRTQTGVRPSTASQCLVVWPGEREGRPRSQHSRPLASPPAPFWTRQTETGQAVHWTHAHGFRWLSHAGGSQGPSCLTFVAESTAHVSRHARVRVTSRGRPGGPRSGRLMNLPPAPAQAPRACGANPKTHTARGGPAVLASTDDAVSPWRAGEAHISKPVVMTSSRGGRLPFSFL